jgi:SNF2 family DNA or RNA helicase
VASSPLVAPPPRKSRAAPKLRPWHLSGIEPTRDDLIALLSEVPDRSVLAPGVVAAADLSAWAVALRLAWALAARQRFVPGLDRTGAKPRAVWDVILDGDEAPRVAALAASLPPSSRALVPAGSASSIAPATPALSSLRAFLAMAVDHLVRPPARLRDDESAPRQFDSLDEQWLHALSRRDGGVLKASVADLDRLESRLASWRQPLAATAARFRLCFRLEEPTVERGPTWYLRFLLQATDDPSVLVPVSEIWGADGPHEDLFRKRGFRPREYLLAAFGRAANLSPTIERSLRTPRPEGADLDTGGAHAFLAESAYLLEQDGFGVLVPSWWSRPEDRTRLVTRLELDSPDRPASGLLSLGEILTFRWKVAIGDQDLTWEELRALAELKVPLVQVRGRWVALDPRAVRETLARLEKAREGTINAREAVHLGLGLGRAPGGVEADSVEAGGWLGELLGRLQGGEAAVEPQPVPDSFVGTLRPYQERGYAWLAFLRRWGLGACLADDMGLGKTVQTLAAIQQDWDQTPKRSRRPTLLVCPTSVVGNWLRESTRFTPDLDVLVHHGLDRARDHDFRKEARARALVVTSYALLHRDADALRQVDWAGVVLDEAQNIKNPETKQARAARSLNASFRIALTGTPVENHVGDLWSILEFLNPGLLGNQASFRREFQVPIQLGRDAEAIKRLQQLTGPFVLRRVKSDKSILGDLPDKLEMKVFCTLTTEQATLYEAVVEEAAAALAGADGIQRKGLVLATLTRLKQVCNHPTQFLKDGSEVGGRSGKLARLLEMLDEMLDAGDRALVFTQFREMGLLLQSHLQDRFGREVPFLHGGVPKSQRDQMVETFQAREPDGPSIFLLTTRAGGTGLNLTAANHVFHYDRWWNPAVENQATDRAYRIGQTRGVQVHKFLCAGTLEERIDELIESKQRIAGTIVGAGEEWLTKLSTDELRSVIALRRDSLTGDMD